MNKSNLFLILFRYIIALFLGVFALDLIYYIFTPFTVYPSYIILKLFYSSLELVTNSSTFILSNHAVRLVDACIAGSAYLLLFLLNLITPMSLKTRLKSIIFVSFTFLLFNVLRIVLFSTLYFSDFSYFDLYHRYVWYLGSTLLVVLIWFLAIKLFKIKAVPGYSDIIYIFSKVKSKKLKRKSF